MLDDLRRKVLKEGGGIEMESVVRAWWLILTHHRNGDLID